LRDLDLTVLRREDFLAPLARDFAADFLPDRREDLLPPNFLPPDLAVLRD
jgi:hypothetical protein